MPVFELGDGRLDGVAGELGPLQDPAGAAKARDPGALGVVAPTDDHHPVAVGEGALALSVGIAGGGLPAP